MALTNAYKEAVNSGNMLTIRIMMKDSLLNDRTFSEFNEMSKIAQQLPGLYEKHDGRELENDRNMWNDAYMDKIMVQAVGNFSHERLNHLKEVVKYLRPATKRSEPSQIKTRTILEKESTRRETTVHPIDHTKTGNSDAHKSTSRGTKVAGGAFIGAAVGGMIASVTSVTIISGLTVGAVAGAVVVSVVTNGDQ